MQVHARQYGVRSTILLLNRYCPWVGRVSGRNRGPSACQASNASVQRITPTDIGDGGLTDVGTQATRELIAEGKRWSGSELKTWQRL